MATGGKIPDFTVPLRLVVATYLLALATYLYNDITDFKTDSVNNRGSVYALAKTKQKITKYYTFGFFLISTVLAFSINSQVGIVSIAFSVLAVLYSHPRVNFKSMFVVKTAVTGAGAFLAGMMGCFASGGFSYLGFMASLIAFCFYFILGPLGDIGDIKGDKEDGRRTFPIVIGIKRSFLVMAAATVAILSIFLISNLFLGISIIGVGLGLSVTVFMLARIFQASKKYESKVEISKTRRLIRYCIFGSQISMLCGAVFVGTF